MKSMGFPKMFNTPTSSNIIEDGDATLNNLKILLGTEKGTLSCDPYFGIRCKQLLFDQNNGVLKDILTDEIYSQILLFMPQLTVNRKDITILQPQRGKLVANIRLTNKIDFSLETYSVTIYQEREY